MSRRAASLWVAVGFAVWAALAFGALGWAPVPWRLALAGAVLILLPGFALVRLLAAPPGGALLAPSWALGFGVAWNAALLLAAQALGARFTALLSAAPWAAGALWAVALARTHRPGAPHRDVPALGAGARVAIVLAAGVAALHVAQLGTPLTYLSDSPDHIGTIRRMLEHGEMFPSDAFFRDAGPLGADPRKGLWHPQVALLCRLAAADPVEAWRWLSTLLAPAFVLAAASLGMLLRGGPGAGVAAWAFLITYGGGLGHQTLREAVYSTKLADQLALATAVAVLADLTRPSWRARLAAAALGFGAVACHVFAALQFALVFAALGLALVIRDRGLGAQARRLAVTAGLVALAAAPYVIWRARASYAPANVIHTEPQGLMWVLGDARVVMIGVLWEWMSILWPAVPLAWWPLWRHGRRNPAALYLLASSLAVFLVIFDPPVVAALQPRLGYLLMRMIWIVPLAGILAWVLPGLVARLRSGPKSARPGAAIALAGLLLLSMPMVGAAVETLLHPEPQRRAEAAEDPRRWSEPMRWLDARFPNAQVVLSDPATSYGVPMLSRHYVVTLLDQHSSPSDSLALRRIVDARDALDPYGSWARTREVVDRYRVDLVMLNGTFTATPGLDYWAPGPAWYQAARARLESRPLAFERLYDRGDIAIYRVHRAALDTLAGAPRPRPFVLDFGSGRFPIAQRIEPGRPVLHRLQVSPTWAAPGETLRCVADWRALEPQAPGAYRVSVRFDRPLPGGLSPPPFVAKPVRKLVERARRERYRFRDDHMPARGEYPVDEWREDQVVRDSFRVIVPHDVAEGRYQVQIRMFREPHYQNLRLSDFFFDSDRYSGPPVAQMVISRQPPPWRRAAPGARVPERPFDPHRLERGRAGGGH